MKLKCLNCEHEFENDIELDELGWHSVCPKCGSSFDVGIPKGKILMLLAGDVDWDKFEDNAFKNVISEYYAFNSIRAFMCKWRKIVENPKSMWYWVIDAEKNECICSGAIDPCDIDVFKEYFGRLN